MRVTNLISYVSFVSGMPGLSKYFHSSPSGDDVDVDANIVVAPDKANEGNSMVVASTANTANAPRTSTNAYDLNSMIAVTVFVSVMPSGSTEFF